MATRSPLPTAEHLFPSCHAAVPTLCPQYSSGWLKPKSPGITAVFPDLLSNLFQGQVPSIRLRSPGAPSRRGVRRSGAELGQRFHLEAAGERG